MHDSIQELNKSLQRQVNEEIERRLKEICIQLTSEKITTDLEIFTRAILKIAAKNPNAVNREEAADMAVEFHMLATKALHRTRQLEKDKANQT